MRDKFIFLPSNEVPKTHQKLLEETLKILSDDKVSQKKAESDAISKMMSDLSGPDKHAVLWNYEKAHLNAGADWEAAKFKLRSKRDANTAILVTDFWDEKNNRGTAQVEGLVVINAQDVIHKLGTVFLGDARFTDLRPQPKGLRNKVYVLGRVVRGHGGIRLEQDPDHTRSHFVWLPNSKTYVRRFVTRGLNHNDIINIAKGADLGAPVQTIAAQKREVTGFPRQDTRHAVTMGANLDEKQQILSHTRGWQKRYISTGISDRPVFSTRGEQFMSLFGTAVIDLAQIDLSNVFDIHSPIAVKNLLGWNATAVTTATDPGNPTGSYVGEKFLALRDVLRTRELLIKFQVPYLAINCLPDGKRIVGIGCTGYKEPDILYGRAVKWPAAGGLIRAYETRAFKVQKYNV